MKWESLGANAAIYVRVLDDGQRMWLGAIWFDTGEGAWRTEAPFGEKDAVIGFGTFEHRLQAQQVVEEYVRTGRIPDM